VMMADGDASRRIQITGTGESIFIGSEETGGGVEISAGGTGGDTRSRLQVDEGTAGGFLLEYDWSDGGDTKAIEINGTEMRVTDEEDATGLIYDADYSSNYTDRSIVDKEYVDKPAVISHSLTDGAPTDAQIDSATGTTPAAAGSGRFYYILDSDGSGLMYIIISDGTNWQYTALTIAT